MKDYQKHSFVRQRQDCEFQAALRWIAAHAPGEAPKPAPPVPAARPEEDIKRDPQLQRAVDLLKAMRILDRSRPASSQPTALQR